MFDSIWGLLFIPINLLVPIIFCFSGEKFTLPKIKKIVIINGICVFLFYTILRAAEGIEGTPYGVVVWSYVAYMIMKKKCLKTEEDSEHIKIDFDTIMKTPNNRIKPETIIIVLTILLVLSILLNIIQYIDNKKPDYYMDIDGNVTKLETSDYYDSSDWAYNEEKAIALGYKAYYK